MESKMFEVWSNDKLVYSTNNLPVAYAVAKDHSQKAETKETHITQDTKYGINCVIRF